MFHPLPTLIQSHNSTISIYPRNVHHPHVFFKNFSQETMLSSPGVWLQYILGAIAVGLMEDSVDVRSVK